MAMTPPTEPGSDATPRHELQTMPPPAPAPAPQGRELWLAFLRHYLLAVQRFTRLPLPARLVEWIGDRSPEAPQRTTGHYPGVGWLAGLVAALVYGGLLVALPGSVFAPLVAAVFCTVATTLLTAAASEQALVRAVDAGSEAGTTGTGSLVLGLALLAKLSLMALLGDSVLTGEDATRVCVVVWLAQVLPRGATLLLALRAPPGADAPPSPFSALMVRTPYGTVGTAVAWCAGALALAALEINGRTVVLGLLLLATTAWTAHRWFDRRPGGRHGDALGATQLLCEIALLLGAAFAT